MHGEDLTPSGLLLSAEASDSLQTSSCEWYDQEVTRQGKSALNRQLNLLGIRGEKSAMSFLNMTRAQVQTLIGRKGKPTRENLDAALRRTGAPLSKVVDESKKRQYMIKNTSSLFQQTRRNLCEITGARQLSPIDCDRIVRDEGLHPNRMFTQHELWLNFIADLQDRYDISRSDSVAIADWLYGRMLLDGFRAQMISSIQEYGGLESIDIHDLPESPQSKVAVILKLYSGFKGAEDRVEVARRTGLKKSECEKEIDSLIEFCGLEPQDFEPSVSSLPLLLLKSEETFNFVSDCMTKSNARRKDPRNGTA